MLQQLSHYWKEWVMRRRTAMMLYRLDRHMLADIGVPEDRIAEFADPRRRPARLIPASKTAVTLPLPLFTRGFVVHRKLHGKGGRSAAG